MIKTLTLALLLALPLSAMTVPSFTEAELREHADVVVEGVVAVSQSRRVGQRIITFVSIVSGTAPLLTTTLVAVPGGNVGGITQRVPGAPVLEVGRRYRLYLGPATGPRLDNGGSSARGVFGFFRGVFLLADVAGGLVPLGEDGLPANSIGSHR